ncbi:DUF4383 domain-containing protein [Nitrolancea hollandica]|uniref:DUF4383 domain-containing protein n=1 Tax=Nitrolancea hollandica Lb TaxID=1129897 RepID=I4ELJ2_9BACT|nr:DUF4383 domain-containing protein [Nitrolancea hollandica]CCF85554.1 conserved membrane hypothetical protein [Nitrolancea hollandica Lb]
MRSVRIAAKYLCLANLFVGIAAFFAPAVTGNSDRILNIHPGRLFGIFAVNWLHALMHVVLGLAGISAWRRASSSVTYLQLLAAVFGALSIMGFSKGRGRSGIYFVMGMALNRADNILHGIWAGAAALFAVRPRRVKALR